VLETVLNGLLPAAFVIVLGWLAGRRGCVLGMPSSLGVKVPGRASAPRFAAPHILPSAVATTSALRLQGFRGSFPHPTRSLCTLRHGRHLPQRNTRYLAGATPYPGRTFTGWIAPASLGAPLLLQRGGLSPLTPRQSPGAPTIRMVSAPHPDRRATGGSERAKSAVAGTSTRRISECMAVGSICIARSIATASWSM